MARKPRRALRSHKGPASVGAIPACALSGSVYNGRSVVTHIHNQTTKTSDIPDHLKTRLTAEATNETLLAKASAMTATRLSHPADHGKGKT